MPDRPGTKPESTMPAAVRTRGPLAPAISTLRSSPSPCDSMLPLIQGLVKHGRFDYNRTMDVSPLLAGPAGLIADPRRARILAALMDGRPRTATELAYHARVSPQTTSSHLAKLVQARLLAVEAEGRFRQYRLAGSNVGHAIEGLLALAGDGEWYRDELTKGIEPIRIARTCYDHLAGRLGVALTQMMVKKKFLKPVGRDFRLTPSGDKFLKKFGVDVEKAKRQRRAFARQCRDWIERQPHLAGALGSS